ncbi:hypothetical protein [Mycobacterium intracellulare]|uniref:hypothetical protein n=1 Tax=Mycobacterium intracellulare TaxID=1767 RepID=UPI001155E41D|nr:hypothetical protein [Mycobacterium intracellulare]
MLDYLFGRMHGGRAPLFRLGGLTRGIWVSVFSFALNVGGVLIVMATPPAHATDGPTVTVTVVWGPQRCVFFKLPTENSGRLDMGYGQECSGGQAQSTYYAPPGTYVGIQPVMGNNNHVGCSVADAKTGEILASDQANLGDGHVANCIRQIPDPEFPG